MAAIADDNSFMLVYLARGQKVMINMNKIKNSMVASWYSPRNGNVIEIGNFGNDGINEFTPPSSGENNDWLLVLDDAKADNLVLK